ncbi:MAG: phosphomannomutase/phosphoglucomutase, partial [Acidimicrobiaceae bacterium]
MPNLDAVVKAYDIRGTVPDQLDETLAHAFGVAFAKFSDAKTIVVGHDMRPSGLSLIEAFQNGLTEQGVDVINLGLASTDMLYFASGKLNAPGAMFTASHNPAQYNGIKCCLSGARSIGIDNGLREMKVIAQDVLDGKGPAAAKTQGEVTKKNMLAEFVDHVVSFIDVDSISKLRVVA